MSDGVQMEINVGGVRLAIAVRVLGGEQDGAGFIGNLAKSLEIDDP